MFKTLKNMFRASKPPEQHFRRPVRARFDAAQTTRDNSKHWAYADQLSADMEASPEVRRTLRMRSRYEVANNSYARGLVQMLANDTIGTGPRLQMLSADESFNDEVERAFMRWAEAVRLAPKLRTMRMARCQDGEAFAVLATNPKVRSPVKLDLMLIEADRVSGGIKLLDDGQSVDGITFDQWGNPTSYRVLKYHPGDCRFSTGDEAVEVPAEWMIHIFRQDRPGLHRGVPELTSALPLFAQLRRYNLAVLSAAEAAADFAAILYTDAPPSGEAEEVEPMDTIPLERNMMLTVPSGWKMDQLDPKQPAANHAEFVKIILSEIARCAVTTYGTLAGDYSGHNYASGRLDNQIYHKSILVDRSFWETEVLNRIFEAWFREYLLTDIFVPIEESHTWFWDGFPHVDPNKEATAQERRLNNLTTTLAAECAKDGTPVAEPNREETRIMMILKAGVGRVLPDGTIKVVYGKWCIENIDTIEQIARNQISAVIADGFIQCSKDEPLVGFSARFFKKRAEYEGESNNSHYLFLYDGGWLVCCPKEPPVKWKNVNEMFKNHIKKVQNLSDGFFDKTKCDRCGGSLEGGSIMSRFNTDTLCLKCIEEEKLHPDYQKAAEAELAAVKRGDRDFPGIGWPGKDGRIK